MRLEKDHQSNPTLYKAEIVHLPNAVGPNVRNIMNGVEHFVRILESAITTEAESKALQDQKDPARVVCLDRIREFSRYQRIPQEKNGIFEDHVTLRGLPSLLSILVHHRHLSLPSKILHNLGTGELGENLLGMVNKLIPLPIRLHVTFESVGV